MLHRLAEPDEVVRNAYADFDYKRIFARLSGVPDLGPVGVLLRHPQGRALLRSYSSVTRKAALTVIDHAVQRATVIWLAPIAVLHRRGSLAVALRPGGDNSVHLEDYSRIPRRRWRDEELAAKWRTIRNVRRVVTGGARDRACSRSTSAPRSKHRPWSISTDRDDLRDDDGCRSRRAVHHLERDADRRRSPGGCVPPARRAGRRGRRRARRSAPNARVRGRSRRWSAAILQYPDVTPRDAQALREWEANAPRARPE